jgi:hypothetical protein
MSDKYFSWDEIQVGTIVVNRDPKCPLSYGKITKINIDILDEDYELDFNIKWGEHISYHYSMTDLYWLEKPTEDEKIELL